MLVKKTNFFCLITLCLTLLSAQHILAQTDDPLPSWNDGAAKKTIIAFVKETTEQGNPKFVPVEERIATFDQDGTLWVEQPIYSQVFFAIDRLKALAPEHPEWKDKEPYKTVISGDQAALAKLNEHDIVQIVAVTHSGMSLNDYHQKVHDWLQTAVHPKFNKPFTQLVYQPMLEVMQLMRKNGFKTYIVSGGGQEFIRVYADKVYGVPSEQVIGTAGKVKYDYQNGHPVLIKLPEILFVDDFGGKPEGINLIIGKRPIAAFGNSIGDQQMLEWTQGSAGTRLELLVHHDDAVREYAYGPDSKVGTFSDALMEEAKQKGWIVVSMKDDWKLIFPFNAN